MTIGQIVERLRAEGFDVGESRIRFAAKRGFVSRPTRTAGNHRRFTERNLAQLRSYLTDPPRKGRPPIRYQGEGNGASPSGE